MLPEIKTLIENDIKNLELPQLVDYINELRYFIHQHSPFKAEPVDYVKWVWNEKVVSNDYNPNKVAPPEMELLEISIMNDGYTQPIVTWPHSNKIEVIDGFHRSRVGKESKIVKNRVMGFLPTVIIRKEQEDKNDRIASTIRHNRARGKHQIDAMSEIVIELKNRNWKNERIARELGMDEDEVLRLCQITGLEHLFTDNDFSMSWEASDSATDDDFEPLTDDVEGDFGRTVNTSDQERVFYTYDKWECHKAGFYASKFEGLTKTEAEQGFADLLKDSAAFESALNGVINDWYYSCQHYLTNKAMNRIAWLGQAAVCYATGIPSTYSAGWNLLTEEEQSTANLIALKYLNIWRANNNKSELSLEEALSVGRQVNIY